MESETKADECTASSSTSSQQPPTSISSDVVGIIMQRAENLLAEAEKEDQKLNYKNALKLYSNVLQLLFVVAEKETDEERSYTIRNKMNTILTRAELVKELQDNSEKSDLKDQSPEVKTLFKVHKVNCYLIDSKEGKPAETIAADASLQIIEIPVNSTIILQIGESFAYQLSSTVPCLAMKMGNYILSGNNQYYGITFPGDIHPHFCKVFEELLSKYCNFKQNTSYTTNSTSPSPQIVSSTVVTTTTEQSIVVDDQNKQLALIHQQESTSTLSVISPQTIASVAEKIDLGGKLLAHGILTTSDYLRDGIKAGGEKLKQHIQPEEKPIEISPALKETLQKAKAITPHFVAFSDTLVSIVSVVAKEIGGTASGILSKKISSSNGNQSESMKAAKEICGAGVVALVNVWNALEEAGETLLTTTGTTAADVIHHKYGAEASQVVNDGFCVTHDIIKTGIALESLGPKSVAKKIAKTSTKTAAKNLFTKGSANTEQVAGLIDNQADSDTPMPDQSATITDISETHTVIYQQGEPLIESYVFDSSQREEDVEYVINESEEEQEELEKPPQAEDNKFVQDLDN